MSSVFSKKQNFLPPLKSFRTARGKKGLHYGRSCANMFVRNKGFRKKE
jgi:hypothetical protein